MFLKKKKNASFLGEFDRLRLFAQNNQRSDCSDDSHFMCAGVCPCCVCVSAQALTGTLQSLLFLSLYVHEADRPEIPDEHKLFAQMKTF